MPQVKLLLLTKYGRIGASSRLRSLQYQPIINQDGIEVIVNPLLDDSLLRKRYAEGRYDPSALFYAYVQRIKHLFVRRNFDVVWIEKEALPWWPVSIELLFLGRVPYILDFDDAIFHSYDLHSSRLVRSIFGKRIDCLMNHAALVIAGNSYLAARASKAGARWIEIVPTVIDLERYPLLPSASVRNVPRIVWIGSPSTAHYLSLIQEPLKKLAREMSFVLRVIGAQGINMPGVDIEYVVWSEESEVNAVLSCDIGIMPLVDSPWEQGKCGYKLIQYMACHLPVVASAVGANLEIVDNGVNGFLAADDQEWFAALRSLLRSPELRISLGRAGRAQVEEKYCVQKTGPRIVELLHRVAEK